MYWLALLVVILFSRPVNWARSFLDDHDKKHRAAVALPPGTSVRLRCRPNCGLTACKDQTRIWSVVRYYADVDDYRLRSPKTDGTEIPWDETYAHLSAMEVVR